MGSCSFGLVPLLLTLEGDLTLVSSLDFPFSWSLALSLFLKPFRNGFGLPLVGVSSISACWSGFGGH